MCYLIKNKQKFKLVKHNKKEAELLEKIYKKSRSYDR